MKMLPRLFLFLLVLGVGCKKSEPVQIAEVKAHVELATGNPDGPAVDQLIIDSTSETVIPINKVGEWPRNNLTPVMVRFIDTGKRLGNGTIRVVYMVTLRQF